jgi:hypothetical protein
MKTGIPSPPLLRFVALLPHRDIRPPLLAYKRALFAAGFPGAYSFPAAAPLALCSRPFTAEELKALARGLREAARAGEGGKIRARSLIPQECPGFAFLGLALDLRLPPDFPWPGAALHPFPAPALCAAVLKPGEAGAKAAQAAGELPGAPPPPSFRAAAVANMILRPLPSGEAGYSFAWQTGRPRWLPG